MLPLHIASLPNAKVPEHNVKQLLHIHVPRDDAKAVGGHSQLLRCHVHLQSQHSSAQLSAQESSEPQQSNTQNT
jgi:hypothetical protein